MATQRRHRGIWEVEALADLAGAQAVRPFVYVRATDTVYRWDYSSDSYEELAGGGGGVGTEIGSGEAIVRTIALLKYVGIGDVAGTGQSTLIGVDDTSGLISIDAVNGVEIGAKLGVGVAGANIAAKAHIKTDSNSQIGLIVDLAVPHFEAGFIVRDGDESPLFTVNGDGNLYIAPTAATGVLNFFHQSTGESWEIKFPTVGDVSFTGTRPFIFKGNGAVNRIRVDDDVTGGNTRLQIYDVDNAQLERVSVGAPDSGGAGFKVLRIPN